MKQLLPLLLVLLGLSSAQSQDCFKTIDITSYNLSVCIDEHMGVDESMPKGILIRGFSPDEEDSKEFSVNIFLTENFKDRSLAELLADQKEEFNVFGQSPQAEVDSTFSLDGRAFALSRRTYQLGESAQMMGYLAVAKYRNECFIFRGFGAAQDDGGEALDFMLKVLKRSKFTGEPVLVDESPLVDAFIAKLQPALSDPAQLKKLQVNREILFAITSEEDQEKFEKEWPQLEQMLQRWTSGTQEAVSTLTTCTSIAITQHDIEYDLSVPGFPGYTGKFTVTCDQEERKFRMMAIKSGDQLYLSRMKAVTP